MKSILLGFAALWMFAGAALAVQSINQPFPKLKLTDGRVLENARLKAFNSDSVFVRDDDGIVQVPYKLFPAELQPQLAKARAAENAPPVPIPAYGGGSHADPVIASPAARVKRPFPHETLGVGNGCFVESVCFYDHYQEIFGADPWVRVLQWGAKENDVTVSGHAVAVFELREQLWAWDVNFGFMPLNVPLDSKGDIAQVASPLVTKYPGIVPQHLAYRCDVAPQPPETHLPEVLATHEVRAFRDATLAGARLGAHRPVNVMQFSYVDDSGATLQSAATVFIFNGKVCIYFPEHGTFPFNLPNLTIFNLQQLQWAIRRVYPGAYDLKSLNYPQPGHVSADGQN
ncbi:MAG TPA: hypothetical protein VNV15_02780 [Opitutaceae bacterium]|jgi:hypothetical protein|nr:hypothetical protein [Opitutaceae bacterium]